MDILKAFISACGGGIVAGIFALISARRQAKSEKAKEESAVVKKLGEIEKKLDSHIKADEAAKADDARTRVLRFADEVRRGEKHTEEHWNDILSYIDRYEDYCETHPDYPNNKTVRTIAYLKNAFDKHFAENTFLEE